MPPFAVARVVEPCFDGRPKGRAAVQLGNRAVSAAAAAGAARAAPWTAAPLTAFAC